MEKIAKHGIISHEETLSHPFKLSYWQKLLLSHEERRSNKIEINLSKPMKKAQNKSVKGQLLDELICCLLCRTIILVKLCIYNHMKANNQN